VFAFSRRLPALRAARPSLLLAVVAALVAALLLPVGVSPAQSAGTPLAAPLPADVRVTYVDKAEGKYVFRSRAEDLATVAQVFNTVVVSASPWRYGDTSLVDAARGAGLAPILELDYKDEYVAGENFKGYIDQVIKTTLAHPGRIAGIHVADQINKGTLTPDQMIGYLKATAGRFHAELPGVPVFVDAASWELTCDQPEQAGCASLAKSSWHLQNNAVLKRIHDSGLVDGFFLSNNLKNERADVNQRAAEKARALFPAPFKIVSRSSRVSFPESTYSGSAADAALLVEAYLSAPRRGGIDGVALWSWHRPWEDDGVATVRTFLNKDGRTNLLWDQLRRVAS
jgi:hypothetical protein